MEVGMLRSLKIVPFLVLLCAGLSFAQQNKIYKNKVFGYQLGYPAGFKIKTVGSAVVFSSDIEDKTFAFSPSVNIVVIDLGAAPVDIESFYKQSKDALARSLGNVKFLEDKKEKLAGISAYRLVYVSRQKKADFKFLQVMCIRDNKAYVLTYTALQEQYEKHLKTAQAIIKSFEFAAN
jgi:hypothetical protein